MFFPSIYGGLSSKSSISFNYRLQTKFAKVMFSQVSVCPQGEYLGRYPPRTGTHTPPGRYTPRAGTPAGQLHPPRQVHHPSHSACWDMINKQVVGIPLECILVTTCKRSLGQGNIFSSVCQEFCPRGVGVWWWYPSMHCRWYPSMPCSRGGWYPSMPCRFPGPHPGGKLRGLARGAPGPHPRGKLRGLQAHTWGVSRPTPEGISRPTPRGCIPACTEADNPPPPDGYCCRQYASYWNAFLFRAVFNRYSTFMQ